MAKVSEKTVDVEVNGKTMKIVVKKPTPTVLSEAQHKGAVVWTKCLRDGILTKKELEALLEDRGIWDGEKKAEQKAITDEITRLERLLFLGQKGSKMKRSQGRDIAVKMREQRVKLTQLLAEKMSMEANTAEALSENAKFDFLVSKCTFDEGGTPYFEDQEDYEAKADGEVAFAAAQALASILYALDEGFESKLPENVFLQKFDFVDEDMSLVNKAGEKVDKDGKRINDEGHYIDDDGHRIDKDGFKLDENGLYVSEITFEDDKEPAKKRRTTKTTKTSSDSKTG
jgi:hypothetical protein